MDHGAHPKPVNPPSGQEEKTLPHPPAPESQIPDNGAVDTPAPHQITREGIGSPNSEAKILPHIQIAETVACGELKTDLLAEQQRVETETPLRWKEKTFLRQTSSGLVVIGEQDDASILEKPNTEQSGLRPQGEDEILQPEAHKPARSSTADWQSYAKPSSGFLVGHARGSRKRS